MFIEYLLYPNIIYNKEKLLYQIENRRYIYLTWSFQGSKFNGVSDGPIQLWFTTANSLSVKNVCHYFLLKKLNFTKMQLNNNQKNRTNQGIYAHGTICFGNIYFIILRIKKKRMNTKLWENVLFETHRENCVQKKRS